MGDKTSGWGIMKIDWDIIGNVGLLLPQIGDARNCHVKQFYWEW
jgi:hypothetical protein